MCLIVTLSIDWNKFIKIFTQTSSMWINYLVQKRSLDQLYLDAFLYLPVALCQSKNGMDINQQMKLNV